MRLLFMFLLLLVVVVEQPALSQEGQLRISDKLYVLPDPAPHLFFVYELDSLLAQDVLLDVSTGEIGLPSGRLCYIFQVSGPPQMQINHRGVKVKINSVSMELDEDNLRISSREGRSRLYFLSLDDNVNVWSEVTLEVRAEYGGADRRTWSVASKMVEKDPTGIAVRLFEVVTIDDRREIRPVPSPRGSFVAYTEVLPDFNDIYLKVLSPDKSSKEAGLLLYRSKQLEQETPFDIAWSPDENVVAYTRPEGGDYEIFLQYDVANAIANGRFSEDRPPLRLTHREGFDGKVDFAPDGTHFAYLSQPPERKKESITTNLVIVNYAAKSKPFTVKRIKLEGLNEVMSTPKYSPDGTWLLFQARNPQDFKNSDIYMVDLDSGDMLNVTRSPRIDEYYPSWSPNGEMIAYFDGEQISTMNLKTREVYSVAVDALQDEATFPPVWSINGDRIYYTCISANQEIAVAQSINQGKPVTSLLAGTSHLTITRYLAGTVNNNQQMLLVDTFDQSHDIYCAQLDTGLCGDIILDLPENLGVRWNEDELCSTPYSTMTNSGILIQSPGLRLNRLELNSAHTSIYKGIVPASGNQAHPYTVDISRSKIARRDLMPKSLLKTMLLPGWGQFDQGRRTEGAFFSAAFLTFLTSAFVANQTSASLYNEYSSTQVPRDVYSRRLDYQEYERTRDLFYAAAAVTWGLSLVDYLWGPPKRQKANKWSPQLTEMLTSGSVTSEPLDSHRKSQTEIAFVAPEAGVDIYMRSPVLADVNWRYVGTTGRQYSTDGSFVIRGLTPGAYEISGILSENGTTQSVIQTIELDSGMRSWVPLNLREQPPSRAYRARRFAPGVFQYIDRGERVKGAAVLLGEVALLTMTGVHYHAWGEQLDRYNSTTDRSEIAEYRDKFEASRGRTYAFGISAAILYAYHLWDAFNEQDVRVREAALQGVPIEWIDSP